MHGAGSTIQTSCSSVDVAVQRFRGWDEGVGWGHACCPCGMTLREGVCVCVCVCV